MAIQESDYMDFGNGIIGDDTFDVWRKKTNRVKVELDSVNTTLTTKINTDVANLSSVYIPQAGSATSVSTALQFTNNITLANSNLVIGARTVSESSGKLSVDGAISSSTSVEASTLQASSNLTLGTKSYSVPSTPSINNAVLTTQTDGNLSWQNVTDIFTLSGGLNQTTTVFEEVMPVGAVIPLAATTNDPNFLLCEGGSVSKSSFPELYEVLKNGGSTCIYGETSTQFTLPDYSGRVLVGTGGTTVTFPSSFGATGGTNTTSTSNHTLTIDEIPAHAHKFYDDRGNRYLAISDANLGASGDAIASQGPNESGNGDTGVYGTTYTGGGAEGGIDGGSTTDGDLSSLSGTSGHSHNITAANRIQPYVTVKWFIKAKPNSKIDFRINLNGGLESSDGSGSPQTEISPVNETITLKAKVDNASIALDGSGNLIVKHAPQITGTITTTGPDLKLDNETRRGSQTTGTRRALVHGNGNGTADPVLNGYDRKVFTTIRDSGVGTNNDTLIINYNDVSPNSVGDYTGGVIINGTKAIAFEDGTVLNTASPIKGDVKKMMARQKGYSGVTGRGTVYFIDHDDQPRGNGYSSEYKNYAAQRDSAYGWNNDYLPDEEEAQDIYLGYYHTSCVTKTGKIFGQGWSNIFGDVENLEVNGQHAEWCRAFTDDNTVKFYDPEVTTIDTGVVNSAAHDARSCYALDSNGLLWGTSDQLNVGQLARGGLTDISDETAGTAQVLLSQKRDELAGSIYNYTGTDGTRLNVPHVMNPLEDSLGNITTTPSNAVRFHTTFTQAIATGGNAYGGIAALGADGKVYTAGYNVDGQCGIGNTTNQSHWGVVKYSTGSSEVELTNVVKIYSTGYVATIYAKTSNGDIYGWGNNATSELGNGTTTHALLATKIWDATARGASAEIYSNGAGRVSGNLGTEVFIVTDHAQPQLWGTGTSNHYGFGQDGDAEDAVYTTWKRVTSGPWNTSTHTVQNFYNCGGQAAHSDPNYCIALNNSTNKLELWVTGYGGTGATGITYSGQGAATYTDAGGHVGSTVKWERIRYINDRFLRKVIDVYPMHMNNSAWNSNWHQHVIHLNDGRIFGVGRWIYGGSDDADTDEYFFKWQELNTKA